ncbi:MAG: hypothetical protein Q7J68_06090 [Thermoplasmata archaeon]|nr:hypothetical protein [Thermoplasmata archaeon]
MRRNYIAIRPDVRAFDNSADMFGHCRKCGCSLVVLPEDRRYGFCFDCLDFLQISRKTEISEGRAFTINHESGFGYR